MNSLANTISPEEQIVLKIDEYKSKLNLTDSELQKIRDSIPIDNTINKNNYLFSYLLKRYENEAMAETILKLINKKEQEVIKLLNDQIILKEQSREKSLKQTGDDILGEIKNLSRDEYDVDSITSEMMKQIAIVEAAHYDSMTDDFSHIYGMIADVADQQSKYYQQIRNRVKKASSRKSRKIEKMLKFSKFNIFKKMKVNLGWH